MESLTNVPFDEIHVGDSASVSRRLTQFDVEAFALVSGDVDAFHIEEGERLDRGGMHAESDRGGSAALGAAEP
jgi:hypothetical protein